MKKNLMILILALFVSVVYSNTQTVYGKDLTLGPKSMELGYHKGPGKPGPKKPHPQYGSKYDNNKPDFHDQRRLRDDARYIIHRTSEVIMEAQNAARRNHYANGLSKAVAHQDWARNLYMRGNYRDAIYHSMRARNIAYQILRENRSPRRYNNDWDDREYGYRDYAPQDDDLDLQINWKLKTDDETIYLRLNLDL